MFIIEHLWSEIRKFSLFSSQNLKIFIIYLEQNQGRGQNWKYWSISMKNKIFIIALKANLELFDETNLQYNFVNQNHIKTLPYTEYKHRQAHKMILREQTCTIRLNWVHDNGHILFCINLYYSNYESWIMTDTSWYILDDNAFPISFDMPSILLHKRFRWVLLEIEFQESIKFIQFLFTFKDFKLKFFSQIQFNAQSVSDRLFLKGSEVRKDPVQNGQVWMNVYWN